MAWRMAMSPHPWRRLMMADAKTGRLKASRGRTGYRPAGGSLPCQRYRERSSVAKAPSAHPVGIPRGPSPR